MESEHLDMNEIDIVGIWNVLIFTCHARAYTYKKAGGGHESMFPYGGGYKLVSKKFESIFSQSNAFVGGSRSCGNKATRS